MTLEGFYSVLMILGILVACFIVAVIMVALAVGVYTAVRNELNKK